MSQAIDAATALTPRIVAVRAETEASRRLPEDIVEGLVDAGLFRVAVPEELGGLELDPLSALELYERLAAAEAAVAWLVWNSALPALFGRFLSAEARAEIFSDRNHKYASSTRPTGRAFRSGDGYRISGRWSLVSGCLHADWIALTCFVHDEDGAVEMIGPQAPHMRMMFVRRGDVAIVDTWDAGGLRGTGSHDVVADDLVVPDRWTFTPMDPIRLDRPLGRLPIVCTMAAGHAAMCLGIAAAALDELRALARSKVTVDAAPGLPHRSCNQFAVARAATQLSALRAELRRAVEVIWRAAREGVERSHSDIGAVWSAAVTTGRTCRSIVAELYEVAGSPALYSDNPLDRRHRDIDAAMQHVIAQRFWIEEAGRVHFGMAPTNPLFAI